jgi:isoleucyl-tRNA synthetase
MAPFVPFLAENVYQNLVRSVDPDALPSVHMGNWPEALSEWRNDALLHDIGVVQKVVGLGRAARNHSGVRTRQPISRVLVRAPNDAAAAALESHKEQILEELNVKDIEFIARDAGLVSYVIKPNLPKLGKQYGKLVPKIRQALMEADGADIAGAAARGEAFEIEVAGQTIALDGDDVLIETHSAEGYSCEADSGYLAALDTTLTDELVAEGLAREVVRSVQDARKQAGLEVSDRITLGVSGSPAVEAALEKHRAYLMNETLAIEWLLGHPDARYTAEKTMGDEHWTIEISL